MFFPHTFRKKKCITSPLALCFRTDYIIVQDWERSYLMLLLQGARFSLTDFNHSYFSTLTINHDLYNRKVLHNAMNRWPLQHFFSLIYQHIFTRKWHGIDLMWRSFWVRFRTQMFDHGDFPICNTLLTDCALFLSAVHNITFVMYDLSQNI